jgi:glutathione S-transferase
VKLYYMPGVCSLAVHIALNEIGASFSLDQVDGETKKTDGGVDFLTLNPSGYVPALETDDGEVLLEAPAILQYVADLKPESGLAPAIGTIERVRQQGLLNFVSSELHKSFGPFFAAVQPEGALREQALAKLHSRLDRVEDMLADGRSFLTGETFTVADSYAAVVAGWTDFIGVDRARWPRIDAFVARVNARPAVAAAKQREGLAA